MHHKLKKYRDFIFGGGIKTKQNNKEEKANFHIFLATIAPAMV